MPEEVTAEVTMVNYALAELSPLQERIDGYRASSRRSKPRSGKDLERRGGEVETEHARVTAALGPSAPGSHTRGRAHSYAPRRGAGGG